MADSDTAAATSANLDTNSETTRLSDPSTEPAPIKSLPQPQRIRRSSGWSIGLAIIVGLIMFGNTLFPRLHFLFDVMGNFQWQWVLVLLALATYQAIRRRWLWMSLILAIAFFPAMNILTLYVPGWQPARGDTVLRVMSLNIRYDNQQMDQLHQLIRDVDPDVICVAEMTPRQVAQLAAMGTEFPYSSQHRHLPCGNVIFSKYSMNDVPVWTGNLASNWLPMTVVQIQVEGQSVILVHAHLTSPTSMNRWNKREKQISQLHELVETLDRHPHIVMVGDFNATTHCYSLWQLLEQTRMRDSRRGFGLQNSWPSWFWPLRICIDHVFVSQHVHVHDRRVEQNVGSDHLPVVADLSFASPEGH